MGMTEWELNPLRFADDTVVVVADSTKAVPVSDRIWEGMREVMNECG